MKDYKKERERERDRTKTIDKNNYVIANDCQSLPTSQCQVNTIPERSQQRLRKNYENINQECAYHNVLPVVSDNYRRLTCDH